MKELSIEEKAKRYDEAYKVAENIRRFSSDIAEINRMEEIFPELKESEDEKIRKELLGFCKNRAEYYPNDPKYKNISAWIAWLEKQGEQNPAWSEEDEEAIGMAIIALDDLYDEDSPDTTYGGYNLPFNKAAERLKSLRPQNRWKPSDEQTEALDGICSYIRNKADWEISQDTIHQLYSLSEQLKKLKAGKL